MEDISVEIQSMITSEAKEGSCNYKKVVLCYQDVLRRLSLPDYSQSDRHFVKGP